MSNTRKVAYNTIVQVISRVITAFLSVVVLGYLTRYLGVAGYGQFSLVFAYLGLFGVLVDFGFFLLQVREVTREPERTAEILGNILGLKLALSLIVFTLAYFASVIVYHSPVISQAVAIGAISQAALSLTNISVSLFQARLQMQYVAIANVVSRIAYLGLIIWGVHAHLSLVGLVGGIAVVNTAAFLCQHWWASIDAPIFPRWDFGYWKKFLVEAFPLGMAVILAMIYFRIDTVMLSLMKSYYEVGIYSTPYKVIEVILALPTIFMSSVFPVMTKALAAGHEQALSVFRKAFDFAALVGLPITFGVMALATRVMVIIAGPDFAISGPVLQWLIWTTAISFFGAVLNYTVTAAGRQRLLLWPYLGAAVFNIAANLIVIPRYSYTGAAIVTVVTELVVASWVMFLVATKLRLTPQLVVFGKALAASLIMYLGLHLLGSTNILLNIGVGGIIYGGIIWATRAVSSDIYKEVMGLRR